MGAAGPAVEPAPGDAARSAGSAGGKAMEVYEEPAQEVPIEPEADVVVSGGGPAGVAAAVTAARLGAKTRLIEVNGCLGGVWTAGLLSWILDASNKGGIMAEILAELDRRGALAHYERKCYDPEAMKLLLDQMCLDAGVTVHLHTRAVAAARGGQNRLALAITESKSGRRAFGGRVFVDATGDGDLATLAGCGFDVGREGSGETQPLSMIGLLAGIRREAVAPFVCNLPEAGGHGAAKDRLLAEMRRAGLDPSYARPTMFCIRDGLFCLMANHEYGVPATDADAISQATLRGRAEVHALVAGLRALGEPWAGVQVVATAEHIGVREGRRIHGRYTVTAQDLIDGKRHDDAVCRTTFSVDVHSTSPAKTKGIMHEKVRAKPYDIPYRALIARDVDGLLTAGRCISGDFLAHSSYRVTGNAVAMGEAAGAAAALAASGNRMPHELDWAAVRDAIQSVSRA
ncbi:MAG: FAD-dependent oxidoreductase [Candidatus Hydrogenedentes bacterium]|nr:FAD-dependent oxidoreductase [Candidatus Hydrogenedentota bacterium]